MERKTPFESGEIYHLYTRGVEKRNIFGSDNDWERFMQLLDACNGKKNVRLSRQAKPWQGEPLPVSGRLADVLAYSLMSNHIHLLVREKEAGGISKFMLKLMTAYSMFFNSKYERSGPLFTRPFRSKHVESDEYLRWLLAYVHLNPLDLFQHGWKEHGIADPAAAWKYLCEYRYSSFLDYVGIPRPQSRIVNLLALPTDVPTTRTADDLFDTFFSAAQEQGTPSFFVDARRTLV